MATLPNLAPQPQEQQMYMNADVQSLYTLFNSRSPMGTNTLVVPNELMVQVVTLWLQSHPQEATHILQALKKKHLSELDIIRTVNSTKNG